MQFTIDGISVNLPDPPCEDLEIGGCSIRSSSVLGWEMLEIRNIIDRPVTVESVLFNIYGYPGRIKIYPGKHISIQSSPTSASP
jgi:hypothetical protein